MRLPGLLVAALLLSIAFTGAARAADGVEARARDHYEAGRTLYRLGNYREALAQFTAGYELVHKPRFLINLAQTFRKLGDDANARRMIERYLAEADLNDPARAQAKELLAELGPDPAPPPTTPPRAPAPAPTVIAQPAPPSVVAAPAPPPSRRASGWRRWGWILPVSIVVVAGVAVGAYFGATAATDPCRGASIGCVSANR